MGRKGTSWLVQNSLPLRGKMLAKEPRLDVLILLSNSGCQTKFCCCLFAPVWVWEMKAGLVGQYVSVKKKLDTCDLQFYKKCIY